MKILKITHVYQMNGYYSAVNLIDRENIEFKYSDYYKI